MARPRKSELLIHKPTDRYYITDPATSKYVYLGPISPRSRGPSKGKTKALLKEDAELAYYDWFKKREQRVETGKVVLLMAGRIVDEARKAADDYFRNGKAVPPAPEQPRKRRGKQLKDLYEPWAEAKREDDKTERYLKDAQRDWQEFCKILRRKKITTLEQLTTKDSIKAYRSSVKRSSLSQESPINYYSTRFRRVKAIINHLLREEDYVDETTAALIAANLRLLKAKKTNSANRPITPRELHALLAVCDDLAMTETEALKGKLKKVKPNTVEHRRIMGQIRQAENQRLIGIQFKAIYLVAVNLMFYPVDIRSMLKSSVGEEGHVRFWREKTKTPRVGILWDVTCKALEAWYSTRTDPSPSAFVNTTGSVWNKQSIGKIMNRHKKLSAQRGQPLPDDLTFAAFRDGGYAAALLDNHVDLYTAKVLAGHKTGITDHYVDAQPERCRLAIESIYRYYFSQKKS